MRYDLMIYAYDIMDQVSCTLSVRSLPGTPEDRPVTVAHMSTTVPGVGESDPTEWARDALVAMLEAL